MAGFGQVQEQEFEEEMHTRQPEKAKNDLEVPDNN